MRLVIFGFAHQVAVRLIFIYDGASCAWLVASFLAVPDGVAEVTHRSFIEVYLGDALLVSII